MTLANLIAGSIPADQRVIVVEAAADYQISHPRALRLLGDEAHLRLDELTLVAAKMHPDWLVIGELQGSEAFTVLQVLGMGHQGLTAIHANSPEDALARLESFCLMANLGLGLAEIRKVISAALKVITYQQRLPNGRRCLTDIVALDGIENGRYLLRPLLRYDMATGSWSRPGR
jgi:pilus assembly protein CpaF